MATFAVLFGTRHIDATEHQEGLIVAVAAESLVKLAAFLTVGFFVIFSMFGGIGGLARARQQRRRDPAHLRRRASTACFWITVTFLSLVCIVLLPRQFHVTVVENNSEKEIRRAAWLFPVYLVLINLFVVPIAAAGLLSLPKGSFDADTFVLALPLSAGRRGHHAAGVRRRAVGRHRHGDRRFRGAGDHGLATAWCCRCCCAGGVYEPKGQQKDMAWLLLAIRRVAIFAIILLGYLFYRLLGQTHGLASIGLVSFAAIAQFAPAFFGGLVWRNATARGAIAGIVTGFAVWAYTLLLPWIIEAGWVPRSVLTDGPVRPELPVAARPCSTCSSTRSRHGVLWSMVVNVLVFVAVSLLKAPEPVERLQAQVFVLGDLPRPPMSPSFRLWRTSVTAGDLQHTVARYLGAERAERSFAEYAESRNAPICARCRGRHPSAALHRASAGERHRCGLLAPRAVAAAAPRATPAARSALRLLDDASEALQYNRDLLQSALDQVRHGLERVRQGHAAHLLEPAVPRAA